MADPDKDNSGAYGDFYFHVGHCVKVWAVVEKHLFDVCHIFLGSSKTVAAVVYGRTSTLEMRISLVNDLIKMTYPTKLGDHDHSNLVTWKAIKKESERLIPTRNVIVHAPAGMQTTLDLTKLPDLVVNAWVEIYAAEHERLRGRAIPPLKIEQVKTHREEATAFAKQISDYVNFLRPPKRRRRRFQQGPAIPSRKQ